MDSFLTSVLSRMPPYTRGIAIEAIDAINAMYEESYECFIPQTHPTVAMSVSIWRVVIPIATARDGEHGRGQAIRELLAMFMRGDIYGWECSGYGHYAPLCNYHDAICKTTLHELVLCGVYTTGGQQRDDDGGCLQRGYLDGSFLLHKDASLDTVLDVFRAVECCNFIIHQDGRFVAHLGTKNVEFEASTVDDIHRMVRRFNEHIVTFDGDSPRTGTCLQENPFGFTGRVVDFTIWDDTFPSQNEMKRPTIDDRLLVAIMSSEVPICDASVV